MTIQQRELHRKFASMFGRTPVWRALHADGTACESLSPERAYSHLSEVFTALQPWRFTRLSRSAGLPTTAEGRIASFRRALREERHARQVVPDRDDGIPDPRPPAFGQADYLELNPDLADDLEIDYPGFSRWALSPARV